MNHVPDKVFEIVVGSAVAVFAFFSKKTFATYDSRIQKTEDKQDAILQALSNVEKQVIQISTKLEVMGK